MFNVFLTSLHAEVSFDVVFTVMAFVIWGVAFHCVHNTLEFQGVI